MAKLINKSPFVDGVTERYDEIVPISELKYDDDNYALYMEASNWGDDEYFQSLCESIRKNGLRNPIVVYDNNTIKSGHTRVKACIELGYEKIPLVRSAVEKPKSQYDNMMALMMENQTRPSNIGRQYNQIEVAVKGYQTATGKSCSDVIKKQEICPAAQMSFNMWSQLKELELNRPDLFSRVVDSNGAKLSPGKAHDLMMTDRKKVKVMAISKAMEEAVTEDDVKYAISAVSNAMNSLQEVHINGRDGGRRKAFVNIQQNTIGGLVHEVFTNAIAHSINHRTQNPNYTVAFPPKQHNDEDIYFGIHNGGIEVKTCLVKDGNKMRFVCKNPKVGYFLFAGFTPDYDRCYISYGRTDVDIWKKAGRGFANIDMMKLAKADVETFSGSLSIDKKAEKVIVHTDKIGIAD